MLLLTREPGDEVEIIAEAKATITVTVVDVMSNGVVKLGFDAPDHVRFLRDNARRRQPRRRYYQEQMDGQENRRQEGQGPSPSQSAPDPEDEAQGNR